MSFPIFFQLPSHRLRFSCLEIAQGNNAISKGLYSKPEARDRDVCRGQCTFVDVIWKPSSRCQHVVNTVSLIGLLVRHDATDKIRNTDSKHMEP